MTFAFWTRPVVSTIKSTTTFPWARAKRRLSGKMGLTTRKICGGRVGASDEIFEAAVRGGMTTLRQDGVRLCVEGVSSLEEIRRVTGDRG